MRKFIIFIALVIPSGAQPVFTDVVPPQEYAARRTRVMDKISTGVAILQGTTERPGEQPLRQNNQFFYVSGVVEPRAILMIDGRTRSSTLFLNPGEELREKVHVRSWPRPRRKSRPGDRDRVRCRARTIR
jgi:Xaa-Pro aminopeptidase